MNLVPVKIRLFLIPLVVIAVGYILLYTFLHWLIVIKMDMDIHEDTVKIYAPMVLAFIPVLIWINPRLRLLRYSE